MAHTVKYTTEMVKAAAENCPLFKEAFEGFTDDQKYRAARAALAAAESGAATEALEWFDATKKRRHPPFLDPRFRMEYLNEIGRELQELKAKIKEHIDAAVSLGLEKNHGMGIVSRLNTVVDVDSARYLFGADGKRIE